MTIFKVAAPPSVINKKRGTLSNSSLLLVYDFYLIIEDLYKFAGENFDYNYNWNYWYFFNSSKKYFLASLLSANHLLMNLSYIFSFLTLPQNLPTSPSSHSSKLKSS